MKASRIGARTLFQRAFVILCRPNQWVEPASGVSDFAKIVEFAIDAMLRAAQLAGPRKPWAITMRRVVRKTYLSG